MRADSIRQREAERMSDNGVGRRWLLALALALALGFVGGAGYGWLHRTEAQPYDAEQLSHGLIYAQAESGRLQCVVLRDKTQLYNLPSGLEGRVIGYLSRGVKVDYLETVTSQDKDESYAVVAQEMRFQRFWGPRHTIPAGTRALILSRSGSETRCRVFVDGKDYDLDFDNENLRFAYVGQWKKVEYEGTPGYVRYPELSDSRLL